MCDKAQEPVLLILAWTPHRLSPSDRSAAPCGLLPWTACGENPLQFGTVTLGEHYKRIAVEGNEYDPYTTLFANKKLPTGMIANLLGNDAAVEEEKETVAK